MQALTVESISFKILPHKHLIHFCIFPTFHPFLITLSPLHSPSFSLNPFSSHSLTFYSFLFIFIFHTYPTYISISASLLFCFISCILLALTLFSNSLILSASLSTYCFFFIFYFTAFVYSTLFYFWIFSSFQSQVHPCTCHLLQPSNVECKPYPFINNLHFCFHW